MGNQVTAGKSSNVSSVSTAGSKELTDRSRSRRVSFPRPRSHRLIDYGNIEDLLKFIEKGGNINELDSSGLTPLHCAILNNDESTVKLLLDSGSDLKPCQLNLTPIHLAAQNGNLNIVQMLINHGASVNLIDGLGSTPLGLAVECNHLQVARLLVLNGAWVQWKDLLETIENGFLKMTKLLIISRPSILNDLKLTNYRFTRQSSSALKLLVSIGYKLDWSSFTEKCRPLAMLELVLGDSRSIRMPPPHYSPEADLVAFEEFKAWYELLMSQPLSLQMLALKAFFQLCGHRNVERCLDHFCVPSLLRSYCLLDIPLS